MMLRLEELYPDTLAKKLAERPFLVLPFGTIEWHSYHLPLGLDGIVAAGLGEAIAARLDAVLAPVSYFAVGGVPYPYTLELEPGVVEPLYTAALREFGRMGFRLIIALTGHFGLAQTLVVKRAALTVMQQSDVLVLPLAEYDLTTDSGYAGDHAGTGETSLLWALRPELVRLDALPPDGPPDGVIGEDPRGKAGPEYGERVFQEIAARAAEMALRLWEAPAIERRDYVSAIAAGVRVLAVTEEGRRARPKSEVPSIGTPAYYQYLQALYRGEYRRAIQHAERKLGDLRA